jgi:hypothetical protein
MKYDSIPRVVDNVVVRTQLFGIFRLKNANTITEYR